MTASDSPSVLYTISSPLPPSSLSLHFLSIIALVSWTFEQIPIFDINYIHLFQSQNSMSIFMLCHCFSQKTNRNTMQRKFWPLKQHNKHSQSCSMSYDRFLDRLAHSPLSLFFSLPYCVCMCSSFACSCPPLLPRSRGQLRGKGGVGRRRGREPRASIEAILQLFVW